MNFSLHKRHLKFGVFVFARNKLWLEVYIPVILFKNWTRLELFCLLFQRLCFCLVLSESSPVFAKTLLHLGKGVLVMHHGTHKGFVSTALTLWSFQLHFFPVSAPEQVHVHLCSECGSTKPWHFIGIKAQHTTSDTFRFVLLPFIKVHNM